MSLLACTFVGLVVGAIAHQHFRETRRGLAVDATAATLGALLGGGFVVLVDTVPMDTLSVWSCLLGLVTASGAVVVHRSFSPQEPYERR